ncbi:MAG: hypothetical protein C4329_00310, partial [Chitinophagaceae bacterium]
MNAKAEFLKSDFVPLLKTIASDTPPKWGKMSLQQMTEHFSDSMRIASGAAPHEKIVTPSENLQRMRDFMLSEKPFKENTPNPLMSETPAPVRNKSIADSFSELQKEIDYFFEVFEERRQQSSRNPFFGDLSFDENVHLLYKHA